MLLSEDGVEKLKNACVAVFGVGGVGGYAVEALARAGVGEIHLIDSDKVSVSNINRQIIATHLTVGQFKTEAMKERIHSINPEAKVVCHSLFFDESTKTEFDFTKYSYVIDAIDSLSAKVELIATATEAGVSIISAMGAGNKLDPTLFEVSDISKYSPIYSFRYCSTSFQSIPFLDLNLISLIRAIFEPSKSVIILTLLFIFLVLSFSYQTSFDI